jgi:eukaryotic-like serine/threonine-protein kinase
LIVTENEDPLLGTLIADRYRVARRIGVGGMGVVYLATHEALRKQVALKVLAPEAGKIDREAIARFEREAITAANVKHPNIVEAIDYGRLQDGGFYLAMEYVAGVTLRRLLDEHGPLPRERAIAIVEQVGAALAAAHAHDVVHRDLKPDNVIVAEGTDRVKVIDFGIAKLRSATFGIMTTGVTQVRTMIGTPEYMSPEQVMGQAVDARADQYTLGVLAFELLTGRPPFKSADVGQLRMMHVGAPVPSLRDHAPGVSPELEAVISKMLAKLPEERFESVATAMRALSDAVSAPPAEIREPAPLVVVPPYVPLKQSLVPPPAEAKSQLFTIAAALAVVSITAGVIALVLVNSNEGTATIAPSTTASAGPVEASTIATAATISPELSAALTDWQSGKADAAETVIRNAVVTSPELAELDGVTKPLAASLADESAASALKRLLERTALGSSRSMASALADVAVTDDAKPRDAALSLLRSRHSLLSKEPLARVRLRDADTCEAFEAAKEEEKRVATVATRRDIERLALEHCTSMVRVRHVCDCNRPAAAEPIPPPLPTADPTGDPAPTEEN